MTETEEIEQAGYAGSGTAEDVLSWALDRFHPGIAVATSLQDSVLIHMAAAIRPDVRVFTIDTGRLPEAAYSCAEEIRTRLGVRIEWYFPKHDAVEQLETEKGLYSFKNSLEERHACCRIRKVEPLNRALKGLRAWVTGQRREESVTRGALGKIERDPNHEGIWKINPLADWSEEDVKQYLVAHRLPYNTLLDNGYPSVGCSCCTRPVEPGADSRSGRWWWEQAEHKECGLHVRNWTI
jgi:phosphoadenosine phosphosulfate reductase